MRGDNLGAEVMLDYASGSPPRAWGQLYPRECSLHNSRITPTCVGTTSPAPRIPVRSTGSPPRAWGQRSVQGSLLRSSRITPTCVGTTGGREHLFRRGKDHPHVRGDNFSSSWQESQRQGSPPRAWGQHPCPEGGSLHSRITPTCVGTTGCKLSAFGRVRITPTCVGTTNPKWKAPGVDEDHPHVRGDNCRAAAGSN